MAISKSVLQKITGSSLPPYRIFAGAEPCQHWWFALVHPDGTIVYRVEHICDVTDNDLGTLLAVIASLEVIPADGAVEILTRSSMLTTIGTAFTLEPPVRFWTGFRDPHASAAWTEVPDIAKARWPDLLYAVGIRNMKLTTVGASGADANQFVIHEREAARFRVTATTAPRAATSTVTRLGATGGQRATQPTHRGIAPF